MYPINFEKDELAALFLCLKIKNNELQNACIQFGFTFWSNSEYEIHV